MPTFPMGHWPTQLEKMFPVLHVNDRDFIELVRKNWQNPNSKFSWFCQALKMANIKEKRVRLNRKPLFIRWLMLCFARPWIDDKPNFLLSWKWTAADFENAVDIAAKADVFDSDKISEKLFRRLKDDTELSQLLRGSIIGIYAWGQKAWADYWAQRSRNFDREKYRVWRLKGKLREFLLSRGTATRNEILRKLDITADQYEMVIAEFRERGLVREQRLPRNSAMIIWTGGQPGGGAV